MDIATCILYILYFFYSYLRLVRAYFSLFQLREYLIEGKISHKIIFFHKIIHVATMWITCGKGYTMLFYLYFFSFNKNITYLNKSHYAMWNIFFVELWIHNFYSIPSKCIFSLNIVWNLFLDIIFFISTD